MPTIQKLKKKPNYQKHNKSKEIYDTVYNTTTWRNLRRAHLMEHPLCEECLASGRIRTATQVHHIKEISRANSILEMQDIGFNPNNLQSLCDECHQKKHKGSN